MENNLTQKIYFATFGSDGWEGALERIKKQVLEFNIFEELFIYHSNNLKSDTEFWSKHSNFIENNRKLYGYDIWKPYLILKSLQKIEEGDILIYTDSGCEWNLKGKERLLDYIHLVNSNDKNILGFQLNLLEKEWTKMDLIDYMGAYEHIESGQIIGGINFFKKTDKTIQFLQEWYNICCNYDLINDSPSKIPNIPAFKYHRHDQSVFSLLCKKYDVNILPDETWYGPNWIEKKSQYIVKPILAARNYRLNSMIDLT
jgi:hypothetical protein